MKRRTLLGGALGMVGLSCAPRPPRATPVARFADLEHAARGHRLWGPPPRPVRDEKVSVAIVGAGVAGLCAAYRLAAAGLTDVAHFELADAAGGTALQGEGPRGPYPWGAHYLTLPNPEARLMRRLLADFGVITGFSAEGRPEYDETMVAAAPEERLWNGGRFSEGLWPVRIAPAAARAERDAFQAEVARLQQAVGADGKFAFSIPISGSSRDPAFLALVGLSFAEWLDQQGFTEPTFRWWVEYGCRDDYGTTLGTTSAWAGLHYHCARRPDPALELGSHVLTWPAGNGWLVQQLRARCPAPLRTGAVVRAVEPGPPGRLVVEQGGEAFSVTAEHVLLCVPTPVAGALLGQPRPVAVDAAPWQVAALQVSRAPKGQGCDLAWDTVLYGSPSLGYVRNSHQTDAFDGPCVLSWYEALTDPDPRAARRSLLAADPQAEAERVLADLRLAHPDIDALLEDITLFRWGHGTARPVVGLHDGRLDALQDPLGAVSFAHTDLSGLSLFEEAAEHGVRAAEDVLARRGPPPVSWRA